MSALITQCSRMKVIEEEMKIYYVEKTEHN
jgi:hypothetical protein